ncbi:MAG: aminotransferase class I/II-fold pyridoxal phosphate-dependent enzyme [Candidatus Odinarchaeia archaeon]
MVYVSERVKKIHYAIRDIAAAAKEFEKKGMKMLYLNIGDPIKYDFDTPDYMKEAICKAVKEGYNGYSDSKGVEELRKAIVEKEAKYNNVKGITEEDVIVTAGVSEALNFVLAAIAEPGDEVLLPGPTYPPYISMSDFFGIKPVTYRCIEEDGWQPDIDDLRKKITDKTRAISIINPNNPTGALYSAKVVKEIVDLAGEHDILVLSDEIYDRMVYEEPITSTAAIAGDVPVIGFNGFSKVYLAPGWRLGYMYFYDPEGKITELKNNIEKEGRVRLCASAPAQYACITALRGPQDHINELINKLKKRRDITVKRLNEIDGISCTKPKGAFYAFPKIDLRGKWANDKEFVMDLLKTTGVVVVFGSGFDPVYGGGHFRTVFLPPPETLEEAFNKLEEFLRSRNYF